MKTPQFWQQRSPREQLILMACALLSAFVLTYLFWIQPTMADNARLEEQIAQKVATQNWLDDLQRQLDAQSPNESLSIDELLAMQLQDSEIEVEPLSGGKGIQLNLPASQLGTSFELLDQLALHRIPVKRVELQKQSDMTYQLSLNW